MFHRLKYFKRANFRLQLNNSGKSVKYTGIRTFHNGETSKFSMQ